MNPPGNDGRVGEGEDDWHRVLRSILMQQGSLADERAEIAGEENDRGGVVPSLLHLQFDGLQGSNVQADPGPLGLTAHQFWDDGLESGQPVQTYQQQDATTMTNLSNLPSGDGHGAVTRTGAQPMPGDGSIRQFAGLSFSHRLPSLLQQGTSQPWPLLPSTDSQSQRDMLGRHAHTSYPPASLAFPFNTHPGSQQLPLTSETASAMTAFGVPSTVPEQSQGSLFSSGGASGIPGLHMAAAEMDLMRPNSMALGADFALDQVNSLIWGHRGLTTIQPAFYSDTEPRVSADILPAHSSSFAGLRVQHPGLDRPMASNVTMTSALGHDTLMDSYLSTMASNAVSAAMVSQGATSASSAQDEQRIPLFQAPPQVEGGSGKMRKRTRPQPGPSSWLRMELTQKPLRSPEETLHALNVLGTTLRSRADPYFDASTLNDPEIPPPNRGGVSELFPDKLYRMLSELEAEGKADIAGWLSHNRAFLVRKPEVFIRDVLPAYFRGQSKWSSFSRQLNLYGFQRVVLGIDAGAYYHELFLRNRPNLLRYLNRVGAPTGMDRRRYKLPDGEDPDFYRMNLPQPSSDERRPT